MKEAVVYQIFSDRRFYNGNPNNDDAKKHARGSKPIEHKQWQELPDNPRLKDNPDYRGDGMWSNVFFGGDVKGVHEKLDYIESDYIMYDKKSAAKTWRRTYPWDDINEDLLKHYREIGEVRSRYADLFSHGDVQTLHAAPSVKLCKTKRWSSTQIPVLNMKTARDVDCNPQTSERLYSKE